MTATKERFSAIKVMPHHDLNDLPDLMHEYKRLLAQTLLREVFLKEWRSVIVKEDLCFIDEALVGYISYSLHIQADGTVKMSAAYFPNPINSNAEIPS